MLKSIADALTISVETLFEQAGMVKDPTVDADHATEAALRTDRRLTESQAAPFTVYRSYVNDNAPEG